MACFVDYAQVVKPATAASGGQVNAQEIDAEGGTAISAPAKMACISTGAFVSQLAVKSKPFLCSQHRVNRRHDEKRVRFFQRTAFRFISRRDATFGLIQLFDGKVAGFVRELRIYG